MTAADYNLCVHQWSDALFRFSCRCTGSREDARDGVQTAFAALWEAREKVPADKAKAWLFQVVYRQSVVAFRHGTRMVGEEARTEKAQTRNDLHLRKTLDAALDKLDERARALVLLKDWEGYSYEEIGRITGLSESQVKVYLHRARKALQTYLVSVENVLS